MSLNSEEINILIYRYLQEAGLHHTAFTLSQEGLLWRSPHRTAEITPGSLIAYLQKGLMYEEIETHLNSDGTEKRCSQPFSLVHPHVCSDSMEMDGKMDNSLVHIEPNKIAYLDGHENTILTVKWSPSPKRPFILSCSTDGTARLWPVDVRHEVLKCAEKGSEGMIVANHQDGANQCDVTCIAWSSNGLLFASGSADGLVRLIDITTDLPKFKYTMSAHTGCVISVCFNKKADLLASCSTDQSVIIWDVVSGEVQQTFKVHSGPVMDVQWRSDTSFASASCDGTIVFSKLGETQPKQIFKHRADVNVVVWDSHGVNLASASDDSTAKIWTVLSDHPVHTLNHPAAVFVIQWRPEPKSQQGRVLATLASDNTMRVWDTERGKCLHLLKFEDPVFSLSFSPDGEHIAVGGTRFLFIYEVLSGNLIRDLDVGSEISEITWSPEWSGKQFVTLCLTQQMRIALVEPFS
ncbi:hypothetical protein P9112_004094 [Eukaryota sp. TZLM1-RC]